jgi:NAD(P)-dependent dehydrogenase (short-subunit alcohol dehydrogenase family)
VQGDVAKIADLDRLFKQIEKLDIVFANAGAAEYAPFGQVNEAQFDRLFASNVKGTLFSVQKALPLMPDGGAIVLTGSVVGSKGFPANNVYAATKAAVRYFARTWTTDLKERKFTDGFCEPQHALGVDCAFCLGHFRARTSRRVRWR